MLNTISRKTTYWLFALVASLMLLTTPFVIQSTFACEGTQTSACGG